MDAYHQADQMFPAPGVELTHPRISSVDAIANHRAVFVDVREKPLQVSYIELPVSIHKQSEVFRRRREAARQGGSIALVGRVSDETDLGVVRGKCGDNRPRPIRAAIVDNKYLNI